MEFEQSDGKGGRVPNLPAMYCILNLKPGKLWTFVWLFLCFGFGFGFYSPALEPFPMRNSLSYL